MPGEVFQLLDSTGRRLYMTSDERRAFLASAAKQTREIRTFCFVMAYTGP
jgi:integrase/recombinase XerD